MRASMILLVSTILGWEKTWSWSSDDESARLVGGFIVKDISQTPYVVSIQIKRNTAKDVWDPVCAGTLLSALYVITACHCVAKINSTGGVEAMTVKDLPLKSWLFLAGAVDVTYPTWQHNPVAQNRTPESIQHHPRCRLSQNEFMYGDVTIYDVAMAKMKKPFDLNTYVKLAELFSFYEEGFSVRLQECCGREVENVISGWGSTEFEEAEADFHLPRYFRGTAEDLLTKNKLKKIKVRILQDEKRCRNRMHKSLMKTNIRKEISNNQWENFSRLISNSLHGQICTWTKSEGPCKGDGGAGVVCNDRSRWFIVGVSSWDIGCGDGIPSVAQGIGSKDVLSWIEAECCAYHTCQDYHYMIHGCDPPVDDYFYNCKLSSTTITTNMTTTASITSRVTHHGLIDHSSARAISPNQITMISALLHYMIKLSWLRSQA